MSRLIEPENRRFPCKIPCSQGILAETGAIRTASPANQSCFQRMSFSDTRKARQMRASPTSAGQSPLRHTFGDDGLDDGRIQRFVVVKPDHVVEFGAGLHAIDDLVSPSVAGNGSIESLLRLVRDAQR